MISKKILLVGIIVLVGTIVGPLFGVILTFWVLPLVVSLISVFIIRRRPITTGSITGLAVAAILTLFSFFRDKENQADINFYLGSTIIILTALVEGLVAGVIYWLIARTRGWETKNELEWLTQGGNVWSWGWVLLFSILGGIGAGYLLCWQDLIRMGKQEAAKKFFLWGGITLLSIQLLVTLLPDKWTPNSISLGLSLVFPMYLYHGYLKEWQKNNPGIARFEKKIILWAVLGLVLQLLIIFIFASIFQ